MLEEIGVKASDRLCPEGKPKLLLLNKIDTEEGDEQYLLQRARGWINPDQPPRPARASTSCSRPSTRQSAGSRWTSRSKRTANGRLLSPIESNTRYGARTSLTAACRSAPVMGKQTLADLERNDQVQVKEITDLD